MILHRNQRQLPTVLLKRFRHPHTNIIQHPHLHKTNRHNNLSHKPTRACWSDPRIWLARAGGSDPVQPKSPKRRAKPPPPQPKQPPPQLIPSTATTTSHSRPTRSKSRPKSGDATAAKGKKQRRAVPNPSARLPFHGAHQTRRCQVLFPGVRSRAPCGPEHLAILEAPLQ